MCTRVGGIVLLAVIAVPLPASAQPGPRQVLAAARQAMGGDAALSAVRAVVVSGSANRDLGVFIAEQTIELACVPPDRFVRRASYTSTIGGPETLRTVTTERDGFAGSDVIRETTSVGEYAPPPPEIRLLLTPEKRAAVERERLLVQQRALARLMLVLFADSPASYPLQFSAGGQVTLPNGGTADAVDATASDGAVIRLLVDSVSHLPAGLQWRERAGVVAPGIGPSHVGSRGASLPAGTVVLDRFPVDPLDVPFLDRSWTLSEYRLADGLNWPHRFVERAGGKVLEDLRLGRFRLNPAIPDDTFKVANPPK
jgi:hypothetical protein